MLELRVEGTEARATLPARTVEKHHVRELEHAWRQSVEWCVRTPPLHGATVVVPPGTHAIGREAFAGLCLRAVVLPPSLRVVGARGFFCNLGLLEVTVPLRCEIVEQAFAGCTALRRVIFGPLERLAAHAFKNCIALEDVQVSGALVHIGEGAFRGCLSLRSIALPPTVRTIGSCAFAETDLTSFTVPPGVTLVGHGLCRNCSALEDVDLNNAERICAEAFKNCALRSLVVPEMVHSIESEAFAHAGLAGGLRFADSVVPLVLIEERAFAGTEMRAVALPQRLVHPPERGMFAACPNLETVAYHPWTPPTVTAIAAETFARCSDLRSVRLPPLLTHVHREAFAHCKRLASINLGDTTTAVIYEDAFFGCRALRNVALPASLTWIKCLSFAESGVHRVTTASPGRTLRVEAYAFDACKDLWSVTLDYETTILENVYHLPFLPLRQFKDCDRLAMLVVRGLSCSLGPPAEYVALTPAALRAELRLHNRWWQHMGRVPPEWRLNIQCLTWALWRRGLPRVVVTTIVHALPPCEFASLP
jgi:hypothetical protein